MDHHKLIIMRHAKSDWGRGINSDFERPLAARGRDDAPRMGEWLAGQGLVPDTIISSPARRAAETVTMVVERLGLPPGDIHWCQEIYAASLNDLLDVIQRHAGVAGVMLIVGHNPGLDELLIHLSADVPAHTAAGKLMTTAAVAVLDYGLNGISTEAGSARLQALERPRRP